MSARSERGCDDAAGGMTRGRLVSNTATRNWEEALVTGNGRQGALVYGDPSAVLVTLSHERLFLPVDDPLPAPDTAAVLPELRASLFAGRFQDAANHVVRIGREGHPGYASGRNSDPYIGAATLTFTFADSVAGAFAGREEAFGYQRFADFATGTVTQRWHSGVHETRHEVFVSRTDDVVVARLVGRLSGRLDLGPIGGAPTAPVEIATHVAPGWLELTGSSGIPSPVRRAGRARPGRRTSR